MRVSYFCFVKSSVGIRYLLLLSSLLVMDLWSGMFFPLLSHSDFVFGLPLCYDTITFLIAVLFHQSFIKVFFFLLSRALVP